MDSRHLAGYLHNNNFENKIMAKKIVILGAGESGKGAAILAQKLNYDVFVSDYAKISQKNKQILEAKNIAFEEQKHTTAKILDADVIIKSPGIPDNASIIQEAQNQNIPIISEIEFASQNCDAKIIAITGSNGKTTTTLLTYHILKEAGLNVAMAGNIGESFAEKVAEKQYDYFVLEISSFQLDQIKTFKPHIAVILNITPDHLDRYQNKMQNYIDSKFKITENQTSTDYLIYCNDDENITNNIKTKNINATLIPFSIDQPQTNGAYKNNNKIIITMNDNTFEINTNKISIQGNHNMYNSMAAGIVARLNEVRSETIRKAMSGFKNAPHRLEKYKSVRGVKFINDSKATNINSTWYALQSVSDKVILIIGGIDKGNDYSIIKEQVKDKVKAMVCIGIDNKKIIDTFIGITELYEAENMQQAVETAFDLADEGDTVLLSPACASQDRFVNYEDRGEQYKQAVSKL